VFWRDGRLRYAAAASLTCDSSYVSSKKRHASCRFDDRVTPDKSSREDRCRFNLFASLLYVANNVANSFGAPPLYLQVVLAARAAARTCGWQHASRRHVRLLPPQLPAADLNDDAAASADIHNLFFRWALGCIMVSGLQRVTCLTLHDGRTLPACLRRLVANCDTF
jgi:hypothetical protein